MQMMVPHPVPVIAGATPVPVGTTAGVLGKTKPGVVIKQIVRQEIGAKKARRRKVARADKTTVKAKRKEYQSLKKRLRTRLVQQKRDGLAAEAATIQGLPAKQRAAARKKIKARLKKAYDARVKMLPTLGRRRLGDIIALINKLNKLKW